ncbi:unnamed protein product [Nippostrongylus brasiliensis]|uniref:Arginine decarboxylase n=1 Tax=Nippostrongylus brasiliensis TaxID=27835 RepID=A0A0N4YD27_NIPBR|nr:unnamed protein product [Nippostrongylus brasiliensis]
MYNCEIWEIPLQAGDTPFHICLIRPRFIGDIVSVKSKMLAEDLKDILDELLRTQSWPRQVVLPTFSIDSEENLWDVWTKHDDINHPHTPFNASIDSPFLFIITQKGTIPLLAGCYAGHPAPINSAYTIVAPEK